MRYGEIHMFSLKRINNIVVEALTASEAFFYNSLVYKQFHEEREEVLRHKWLESEKKGYDIGYSAALIDWIIKHRTKWRKYKDDK